MKHAARPRNEINAVLHTLLCPRAVKAARPQARLRGRQAKPMMKKPLVDTGAAGILELCTLGPDSV
eukprot:4495791-Lingulodinium_polyedra.AAC.1